MTMRPVGDPQLRREFDRIREKVEKLTGERGNSEKTLTAVRRSEFLPLASLTLKSVQAASTPTQAEFNALQTDVLNIFTALKKISNLLGNADIPKV